MGTQVTDEIGDRERAQIRDDALNVLQDALEWCLTPAGWAHIAAILDGLAAGTGSGLDLGDPERRKVLKDATMRLELAGPLRIETVDSAAKPAPPEVRERLNILIDYLSGADGRDGTPGGGR
jgi:hypothetical protein